MSALAKIIPAFLLFLSFLLCIAPAAAEKQGIAFPGDNCAEGWARSEKSLRFDRNNLFDYIDGGAELFLEFGFKELLVQRYKSRTGDGGEEIALELYHMDGPEAAMGIYLTKSGKETPIKGIRARNSGDRYQISVLKGSCFLQVNNFSGKESVLPVMVRLVECTLATVAKGHKVTLLNRLPKQNFVAGSGLLFRGPYALQPIFTFGRGDVLQQGGRVFGVGGDYIGRQGERYTRLLIFYPDTAAASIAFANLANNLDPYLTALDRGPRVLTFEDYREKFGIVLLSGRTIEIEINLSERPAGD